MIPTKIKLLEKEYQVFEVSMSIENKLGDLHEHEDVIEINSEQSETNKKLVLLHELAHALFIQVGQSKYYDDEDLIDCVALGMYSLIKNNDLEFIKEK